MSDSHEQSRDRRSRLSPVASGRKSLAIDYAADDQELETPSRGIHVNTDGTLVLVLAEDDEDAAGEEYVVKAGASYPYAVRKIVKDGSDAEGVLLF